MATGKSITCADWNLLKFAYTINELITTALQSSVINVPIKGGSAAHPDKLLSGCTLGVYSRLFFRTTSQYFMSAFISTGSASHYPR